MKKINSLACAVALTLFTGACTPTTHIRGNLVQDHQIMNVKPGTDSQSTVLHKLGSPTTKAPFDENTWYYIGQETEKRGILDESVAEERIIAITFNEEGVVETINDIDNERLETPYIRRKTPTSGNEITAVQQFLGNLGKFNKGMNE